MYAPFRHGGSLGVVVAALAFLFLSGVGHAQSEPLTLRDTISRVLDANANLRSQAFTLRAAEARIDQAKQRPPFQLGIEAENILGTNRISAFDDSEITLTLGTVLELGGKRQGRVQSASFEREIVAVQQQGERLDVIAEAARRFIRVAQLQEEANLAGRRLELARETRKGVEVRVNAARSPKLEGRNAVIAEDRAALDQSQASSALTQARAQLAAIWGGDPTSSPGAAADLFTMPVVADYSALSGLIDRNPDILKFASQRRLQDAKLRIAEAQRTPDVTVGVGFRRLQDLRSNAFVLSASIPLGTDVRAAAYISEARSLQQGVQYQEQAVRADLLATLFGALEEMGQNRREVETLLSSSIPKASEAVHLAQEGYDVGRFSLLELITTQQQLTDLQRQAIQAAASFHNSLLEIERLTGRSVVERDIPNTTGTP